ncbi:MAG: hypothetical protein AAGE52_22955 [Myxococcota bacterium]
MNWPVQSPEPYIDERPAQRRARRMATTSLTLALVPLLAALAFRNVPMEWAQADLWRGVLILFAGIPGLLGVGLGVLAWDRGYPKTGFCSLVLGTSGAMAALVGALVALFQYRVF